MKASPGRGKLSPQVTDEGAGQQYFALNTPHPALRATYSPFCRYATFSPGAGEICPQGVKAFALGQAAKVDFREGLLFKNRLRFASSPAGADAPHREPASANTTDLNSPSRENAIADGPQAVCYC